MTLLKCCQAAGSGQGVAACYCAAFLPKTQSSCSKVGDEQRCCYGGGVVIGGKYMEHLLELAWYINCL